MARRRRMVLTASANNFEQKLCTFVSANTKRPVHGERKVKLEAGQNVCWALHTQNNGERRKAKGER